MSGKRRCSSKLYTITTENMMATKRTSVFIGSLRAKEMSYRVSNHNHHFRLKKLLVRRSRLTVFGGSPTDVNVLSPSVNVTVKSFFPDIYVNNYFNDYLIGNDPILEKIFNEY